MNAQPSLHSIQRSLLIAVGVVLAGPTGLVAQPWQTTRAPNPSWASVASSADGRKVVAAPGFISAYSIAAPLPIYISTGSGATWIQSRSPSNVWTSVASSADGTKLVAAAALDGTGTNLGTIYVSDDSGLKWRPTSAPSNTWWTSVASSADGNKLYAAGWNLQSWSFTEPFEGNFGAIYFSTNGGLTWTRTGAPTNFCWWSSLACSADGTRLLAGAGETTLGTTGL